MDARACITILRVRWRMITSIVLICLVAAGLVVDATTPVYQASTQVFVSTQSGDSGTDLLSGNTFTQNQVQSYALIATSPLVLQPVITRLGLATTTGDLAKSVTATAPANTVVINLVVTDSHATRAALIANAVAAQFISAVTKLEGHTGDGSTLVDATVVRPASVPASPVAPRAVLYLCLGLLIGLALGIGAAVIRDTFDTTIRGELDVERTTDVAILGSIVFDPDAAERPLIVSSHPRGPRAEAFRQLRTNLRFLDLADRRRSIVVTSSIPGEGRSTTAANLSLTLAAAGARVVLVESDFRRPRIAGYLGAANAQGLTNVLAAQIRLDDALQPWGNGRLSFLGSGPKPPNPSEVLGSVRMRRLLSELTDRFDYVVLDAPPLLPFTDAAVLAQYAGSTLAVVGSGRTTRDELLRSLESLSTVGANLVGIVLNFVPPGDSRAFAYQYADADGGRRPGRSAEAADRSRGRDPEPATDWNALVARRGDTVTEPGTDVWRPEAPSRR